jgi:DNA ligase (NAD+)
LSTITNIETSVGRTGKVLFVCTVDPCKLNGAIITRTGPYNHKEIIEKKIAIGSRVIIKLAGEVIPRIDKVLESDNSLEEFTIPKECPFCHSQLVLVKNSLYCPSGLSCSEQLVNSLIHFCSRGGMNIHGLGESYIRRLVLAGVLKTYSDIFSLTEKDLVSLKDDYDPVENNALLNYRYANKIISNIQARRVVEYNKFLCALGIPGLGNSACLKYVGKTIEEILDMSKDEHVRRLGINTGELAYTYFTTPENNKEINKLLKIIYIVYTF